MKSLYHFFRLIRPLNLAVIALTMGVFQYYLNNSSVRSLDHLINIDALHTLYNPDFLLLVFSTLLIAAAGNIINDYFDLKADRVNKPDQLIIDVHIKRRVAILMNWVFNSLGLLIAFYISWKFSNWFIVLISFASINILWFYSMYFKRTFVVGNILIALLTGIVPIYVLVFNPEHNIFESAQVLIFAGYAFWLNLIREIVKDIADVKGDLLLNSKSLPILLGIRKTKIILVVLYIIALVPLSGWLYYGISLLTNDIFWIWIPSLILVSLLILSIVFSFLVLPNYLNQKKYILSSNLLKLAMLFGLLTPLFL